METQLVNRLTLIKVICFMNFSVLCLVRHIGTDSIGWLLSDETDILSSLWKWCQYVELAHQSSFRPRLSVILDLQSRVAALVRLPGGTCPLELLLQIRVTEWSVAYATRVNWNVGNRIIDILIILKSGRPVVVEYGSATPVTNK